MVAPAIKAGRTTSALLGAAILLAGGTVTAGAQQPCRLALVLGMDISSSVDPGEDALQRNGLAAALRAPEVVDAILSQPDRPVALAMFEWSGRIQQDMVLDWVMLTDVNTLAAATDQIEQSIRSYADFATALGNALEYAHDLFASGPSCDARTLDLSGDGVNNDGFGPAAAYAALDFSQITVNALAIEVTEEGTDHGLAEGAETGLADYFRQHVIHGPGAFVEIAQGFEDFEKAMTRKLLRELQIEVGQILQ